MIITFMEYNFRKAKPEEIPQIWQILRQAIIRRKDEGSNQWQNGYPNPEVVRKDIEKGVGFVLTENQIVVAYSAVLINNEPSYADIIGKWITNSHFVVVHRVAVSQDHLGKGLAKKMLSYIEDYALSNGIFSIRADTNFDNAPMLHIFENSGYKYCGEVLLRDSPRKAFEKVLKY